MCGIVGANYDTKVDFLNITNIMKSRGPDNTSTKRIIIRALYINPV